MYETESKYREYRNTTDLFVSDEESEECSFGSDGSNESYGKLLKKFKTKFQSTNPDMHEFIVMPCGESVSEQEDSSSPYNNTKNLSLYNEEINDVDSNLLNTCKIENMYLGINQCMPVSHCHFDPGRNIAHEILNNLDIQPCVYKLEKIKLLDDQILQNQDEKKVLYPEEFNQTISGMQAVNCSRSTVQHGYDLPELSAPVTSVVTSRTQNVPPKVELLQPFCSTKYLEKTSMKTLKENTINPIGIYKMDVSSILAESNGGGGCVFGSTKHTVPTFASDTPRSSKRLRHAQTSPRKVGFDDSDSSTDEHYQTKSLKRRKHRKRRMGGILFRLSDEDLRKSNSDLFGRTADEEDCLIKREALNACTVKYAVHGDRKKKKITLRNLNIDRECNQVSAENVKCNIESRRMSRKRLVSREEISSEEKENNENECKKLKRNRTVLRKIEF